MEEAEREGRHTEALELLRRDMVRQALVWFAEAGVRFVEPGLGMPQEFAVALAIAAHRAAEELPGGVSYKIQAALMALDSIANLRTVLAKEVPDGEAAANQLAEVLMTATAVGAANVLMTQVRLGVEAQ